MKQIKLIIWAYVAFDTFYRSYHNAHLLGWMIGKSPGNQGILWHAQVSLMVTTIHPEVSLLINTWHFKRSPFPQTKPFLVMMCTPIIRGGLLDSLDGFLGIQWNKLGVLFKISCGYSINRCMGPHAHIHF